MGSIVPVMSGTDGRDKINLDGRQTGMEVHARGGDDYVYGSRYDDYLYGGDGIDVIHGNEGADRIGGGRGADILTGGDGPDTFSYLGQDVVKTIINAGPFSFVRETFDTDRITDFDVVNGPNHPSDRLDIDDLMDEKTNFSGMNATDAIAQGYLYWVQSGTPGQPGYGTTVYIDRNGAAPDSFSRPDLAIAFLENVGAGDLNASHFWISPFA